MSIKCILESAFQLSLKEKKVSIRDNFEYYLYITTTLMYLIFDTETTGIPHNKTAPLTDLENWPRLVQLAWQLHDERGKLLSNHSYIIRPDGFDIPFKAEKIHGISTKRATEEGYPV